MATRPLSSRLARIVAAGALLTVLLPGAATVAADSKACGDGMAVTFTATAPAGLLTAGTHRVDFLSAFTDIATGDQVVEPIGDNAITIDPAAPAYPNTVLLRLFRNTTLLAGGEVASVTAIRPTQDARLYVNVSWLRDEPFFTGEFKLWFRYETSKNHWSAYMPLAASSVKSFCVELNSAVWQRHYGWE